jgi:hypothetical protein
VSEPVVVASDDVKIHKNLAVLFYISLCIWLIREINYKPLLYVNLFRMSVGRNVCSGDAKLELWYRVVSAR